MRKYDVLLESKPAQLKEFVEGLRELTEKTRVSIQRTNKYVKLYYDGKCEIQLDENLDVFNVVADDRIRYYKCPSCFEYEVKPTRNAKSKFKCGKCGKLLSTVDKTSWKDSSGDLNTASATLTDESEKYMQIMEIRENADAIVSIIPESVRGKYTGSNEEVALQFCADFPEVFNNL